MKHATAVRIEWTIDDVEEKIDAEESVLSEFFFVAAPNGSKYKMHLKARFGRITERSLGLFLTHHESSTYCNQLPIDISGTRLTLKHRYNSRLDITKTLTDCIINESGTAEGEEMFCDLDADEFEDYLTDDEINLLAEVRINNTIVLQF